MITRYTGESPIFGGSSLHRQVFLWQRRTCMKNARISAVNFWKILTNRNLLVVVRVWYAIFQVFEHCLPLLIIDFEFLCFPGLIDYNFHCFRQAIQDVFELKSKGATPNHLPSIPEDDSQNELVRPEDVTLNSHESQSSWDYGKCIVAEWNDRSIKYSCHWYRLGSVPVEISYLSYVLVPVDFALTFLLIHISFIVKITLFVKRFSAGCFDVDLILFLTMWLSVRRSVCHAVRLSQNRTRVLFENQWIDFVRN